MITTSEAKLIAKDRLTFQGFNMLTCDLLKITAEDSFLFHVTYSNGFDVGEGQVEVKQV